MKLLHHYRDGYANIIISFEVQLFNSLYTAVFLQKLGSLLTLFLLIGMDVMENLMFLISLDKQAQALIYPKNFIRGNQVGPTLARVLFRCEMVILIEFIEVVVPLVYVACLYSLWHTPNAQYYRNFQGVSPTEFYAALGHVLGLAGVELGFLLFLLLRLRTKFGLPVVAQLGFAIQDYRGLILSSVCLWICISISIPIPHLGTDYSISLWR